MTAGNDGAVGDARKRRDESATNELHDQPHHQGDREHVHHAEQQQDDDPLGALGHPDEGQHGRTVDAHAVDRTRFEEIRANRDALALKVAELRGDVQRFQTANREHIDRIDELETAPSEAEKRAAIAAGNESDLMGAVVNAEGALTAAHEALRAEIAATSIHHAHNTGLLRAAEVTGVPAAGGSDQ